MQSYRKQKQSSAMEWRRRLTIWNRLSQLVLCGLRSILRWTLPILLGLIPSTVLIGCDLVVLRNSKIPEAEKLIEMEATRSDVQGPVSTQEGERPSWLLQRARENMVYLWRDRHSCSGVLATIPETSPPVEALITAGHCIATNPLRRSNSVKTPVFRMARLSAHGHPRIAPFLSSYFFKSNNLDTTSYDVEVLADPTDAVPNPGNFDNTGRLLSVYHDDFAKKPFSPSKGAVHKDYFSLFRRVDTARGQGYIKILTQFDLALLSLDPGPPFINLKRSPFRIRELPKAQPGDRIYRAIMWRDNIKRQLQFNIDQVKVTGFSPDHALIQVCEKPPKTTKDYKSDEGSALLLERFGELYLIGTAAFGNPSPVQIDGDPCSLTTFTHLAAYAGWMKIAASQINAP
jgi:hypothetical protein